MCFRYGGVVEGVIYSSGFYIVVRPLWGRVYWLFLLARFFARLLCYY